MTLLHRRTLIASAALLIAGGARAAGAGQRAPDFTLPDTRGKHCRRQARRHAHEPSLRLRHQIQVGRLRPNA